MPKIFGAITNLRIGTKLTAGFAAVCIVLAVAIGFTIHVITGVAQVVDKMANLRTPIALESTELVGNLYSTLATLRGYLLTGNPQGKLDRAAMWKELDTTAASFDKRAARFTNPENQKKWAETKAIMAEFRAAQDKAEALAFTPDAFPATKLLVNEAAPIATAMIGNLTKMIDEEDGLEATPERKKLLKTMADARGNLATATAQLRMFLLSGDKVNREQFGKSWDIFSKAFAALNAQKTMFTETQKSAFDSLVKSNAEFGPLPEKMFSLRESADYNMPVKILVTEAAPRALKILDLLDGPKGADGTRSGGIKTDQKKMLAEESTSALGGMSFLAMAEWVLLIGGLLISALVAFASTRLIATPIQKLTAAMKELADGNFDIVLPGLGRKDEIGDVAGAVETFKVKSAEKARAEAQANADRELKEATEKAERDRIAAEEKVAADRRAEEERAAATAKVMAEFDAAVGGIAKAAMAGDFSQRVSLEGKEGVIRNLAEAMNEMCDNIGKVMDDLVGMMGALSEGDLTKRIDADYQGAFGTLKNSANATAAKLAETVAEITASAKEVANAAAEISVSTTDLSQRTEEQAAGLEQTSASMEQIAATVKKNAENAQQANGLTASAGEVADRGGAVVASTVEAMSRIEDSSNKIADIIGVIDEIARQTNLLALNAAVEAARAGDAGRGFAVVASEVRSLAQRSSQAAKDIKDLITNSSGQVKDGVDLVSRTGASLSEIVDSIKRVAEIVADIAAASNEQSTGIDQVNKALTQMDEVTQQNSALVEENAATAKTLESQSAAMSERVSFFRIEQSAQRVVAMPTKAAPARPAPSVKRGGPVGRMQSNLATALKPNEFEEF
jgi:methyl-accepting chemotaxis protein